eukprot:CAMPEP_0119033368 /NCGR_PEP_ID=MMETSP1177-20130426/414_1 /TAXON_ID=2985 /ORGANISM="Ochromonas sp, Strain CCMP1899" /LENGTH=341 /DNA_ID=CAMNT_0006990067 /DNA_START=321 /DNA_END=1343 /DNA_ORIENTATION=+
MPNKRGRSGNDKLSDRCILIGDSSDGGQPWKMSAAENVPYGFSDWEVFSSLPPTAEPAIELGGHERSGSSSPIRVPVSHPSAGIEIAADNISTIINRKRDEQLLLKQQRQDNQQREIRKDVDYKKQQQQQQLEKQQQQQQLHLINLKSEKTRQDSGEFSDLSSKSVFEKTVSEETTRDGSTDYVTGDSDDDDGDSSDVDTSDFEEGDKDEDDETPSPTSAPGPTVPSRTVNVLIVDDSVVQRKICRVLIAGKVGNDNWMVNTADSGERALQILLSSSKQALPEIILVDQNMSSAGGRILGHELVERIRQNTFFQDVIIIGVTAWAAEAGRYLLEAGCDDVW